MATCADTIEWERLFREFHDFELAEEMRRFDAFAFARSLVSPVPDFVHAFLARKRPARIPFYDDVRALYGFLLEKRYQERLNLLHFAFNIFDDETQLPQEIIDRTPFPHEDGIPRFIHINDPTFKIEVKHPR
jgi:hypothetical protein